MKSTILLILSILLSCSAIAQDYIIDPSHSLVQIQVTRFGVVDVVGRFKDVTGSIIYNKEEPNSTNIEAKIAVSSYDANNLGGEKAVKSKAFLNAGTYPEITFNGIRSTNENGNHILSGNLTIHGVTKRIDLPYKIKGPSIDLPTRKQSIAFTASTTINRHDFGVGFDKKLPDGSPIIGDDVHITIILFALK